LLSGLNVYLDFMVLIANQNLFPELISFFEWSQSCHSTSKLVFQCKTMYFQSC